MNWILFVVLALKIKTQQKALLAGFIGTVYSFSKNCCWVAAEWISVCEYDQHLENISLLHVKKKKFHLFDTKGGNADKLPQVMSRESVSIEIEQLDATLASISITRPNLWHNCWYSSCFVGNVGTKFRQGKNNVWNENLISGAQFGFLNCPSWVWQCYRSVMINLLVFF